MGACVCSYMCVVVYYMCVYACGSVWGGRCIYLHMFACICVSVCEFVRASICVLLLLC
jgi:hypothetical protein